MALLELGWQEMVREFALNQLSTAQKDLRISETSQNRANSHCFQLFAPAAKSVLLAGDFTEWEKQPIAMQPSNNGIWSKVASLVAGKHRYLFIVDGHWREDPECSWREPNGFGGVNMVVDKA